MRIVVHAKPNAKVEWVEAVGPLEFIVSVKEPPREGRANEAIIRVLADHFGVQRFAVTLVAGFASRRKVVEISE